MGTRLIHGAIIAVFFSTGILAHAQVGGYGIPSTYTVIGTGIESGDIVSFNPSTELYTLSQEVADENLFGIVDTAPVVVFRSGAEKVPVIQLGEVLVNVTDINGAIAVGDKITSSTIPGKGQKFTGQSGYTLGIALQSFSEKSSTSTIVFDGQEHTSGTIRVLLSIGPVLDSNETDPVTPATIFVRESGETETGLETIFRYITAALFALGTIFVVLKTFGPNVGKGVVSIGRNPLAKSSIQAMVVFNIVLILAITSVSFIVSLLIIFLPI